MTRWVALLRGVNVGGNTKVPMPVLRQIFLDAGCTEVVTYINSGNVVFTADAVDATALVEAVRTATGVTTTMVIVTGERLREIVAAQPFEGEESRLLITFMAMVPETFDTPDPESLLPERIMMGAHALYQSLPAGVSKSAVPPRVLRQLPADATGRNLRTARKLLDLL